MPYNTIKGYFMYSTIMRKTNIFDVLMVSSLMFFSAQSNAAFERHHVPVVLNSCPLPQQTDTFTGGALNSITSVATDIASAGVSENTAIINASTTIVKAIDKLGTDVSVTISNVANKKKKNDDEMAMTMLDLKMNYMQQLQADKRRSETSPVMMNTTKEELEMISALLEDNKNEDVTSLIFAAKQDFDNYEGEDGSGFKIGVKIEAGAGVCEGDDGTCDVQKVATPGKTMEKLFDDCSREKRTVKATVSKKVAQESVNKAIVQKQAEAANTENVTQAAQKKLLDQRESSCSPLEWAAKICHQDLSDEEYVEKVVKNEIIEGGNVSSANFLTPAHTGSIGGEMAEGMANANIDFDGNEGISGNTPPLSYTYKSSAQYFAAQDFVDNIISETAVANQPINQRKDLSNAKFQAHLISRSAGLSLSRFSFQDSIANRLGDNLNANMDELERSNVIKESFNGAGSLDQLVFDIENDYKDVSGSKADDLFGMNEKAISIKILQAQTKHNKLLLERMQRNERMELLLASILANSYNSPGYTNYLSSLRGR